MKTDISSKKIALVFDWLDDKGGMEHVNIVLAEMFPTADIFTSLYDEKKFPKLKHRKVHTSFLQKFPEKIRPKHQFLAPFMPMAFKKFDMSPYDIIISSASSGFAKSVQKKRKNQTHFCYCHTPIRYLYHAKKEYMKTYRLPWFLQIFRFVIPFVLHFLQKYDQKAAKDVDLFFANSEFVAKRINRFYKKQAKVVYPGRDLEPFFSQKKNKNSGYYLALGRFIPYKKFDLLVRVFAENKYPLYLAGKGPDFDYCKKLALELKADNIKFLGFVPEKDLPDLYSNAKAFIFPAEEDFGLTPIEAMASGLPVIYYNAGGACESVGTFGIPFGSQSTESLKKVLENFEKSQEKFDPKKIQKRAQEFSTKVFRQNILKEIESFKKN